MPARLKLFLPLILFAVLALFLFRGLELDPQHSDLLWLQKELKKPKTSRFKGRRMNPPSHSK